MLSQRYDQKTNRSWLNEVSDQRLLWRQWVIGGDKEKLQASKFMYTVKKQQEKSMKFTGFTHKWFPAHQMFSLFPAAGSPKLKWLAIERSLKSLSSVIFKRAVGKRSGDSHIQLLRSLLAGFCGLLSHPLWQVYGLRTWLHSLAFENYDNKKPETPYYRD